MAQTVFRTGNSLAITIPSDFVKSVGVHAGDTVKVKIEEDRGRLTYFFSGAKQLLLSELFSKTRKK